MTSIIRKFQSETLIKNHICAFVGFMAGLKLCDFIFYEDVINYIYNKQKHF